MGKKKKGVTNKLAKMSDEDRARYLQHRADIEEEARRRKQELINTYLKNKLKKEENFMRINLAKINQEWRHILRRTKCIELQNELQAMNQAMIEAVNRKDAQIQYILTEMDECEQQYDRSYQTHLINTNKLLMIHRDRLNDLNDWFEQQKDLYVLTSVRDKLRIENLFGMKVTQLKTIMHQNQETYSKCSKMEGERRLNVIQEMESDMKLECERYSKTKNSEIQELWNSITSELTNYLEKTENKRYDYEILRSKDLNEERIIQDQSKVIEQQLKLLSRLHSHFEEVKETKQKHIEALKTQKETLTKQLRKMKRSMSSKDSTGNSKLKRLTSTSNEIIDYFKSVLTKGEQIVNAMAVSRKFETEAEKVLPVKDIEKAVDEPLCQEEMNILEKFWWKFNSVVVQCNELKEEKVALETEHLELRKKLKECMKEIVLEGSTRTVETSFELVPKIMVTQLSGKSNNENFEITQALTAVKITTQ